MWRGASILINQATERWITQDNKSKRSVHRANICSCCLQSRTFAHTLLKSRKMVVHVNWQYIKMHNNQRHSSCMDPAVEPWKRPTTINNEIDIYINDICWVYCVCCCCHRQKLHQSILDSKMCIQSTFFFTIYIYLGYVNFPCARSVCNA